VLTLPPSVRIYLAVDKVDVKRIPKITHGSSFGEGNGPFLDSIGFWRTTTDHLDQLPERAGGSGDQPPAEWLAPRPVDTAAEDDDLLT
jgi:hypothetical protein